MSSPPLNTAAAGLLLLVLLQLTAATTDHERRHLLSDGLNMDLNSQLRDIARQEKQAVMTQQINRATALGGNKETVAHATSEGTRDGRDYGRDVAGHLDRRLMSSNRRMLSGRQLQDNMAQAGADLGLNDSLREAAAAEARSRIKAAVAGGAARESVTSAALRGRAVPLLLRR